MKKGKTTTQDFIDMMEFEAERNEAPYRAISLPVPEKRLTQESNLLLTKSKLSEDKVATNGEKSRDKVETNRLQSRDKVETDREKSRDKVETNFEQSRDKVETQPRTILETKWRQTEDKVETKVPLSALVGLQRKMVIFLYQSCKAARSSVTSSLTIEHISKSCETSASSAKKTLQRLEQKQILRRAEYKDGRGGWTKYEVEKDIFQDLLRAETEDKLETKWRQTEDKVGTQLETQPRTSSLGSIGSINILNTKLTNSDPSWKNVNLYSTEKYGIHAGTISRIQQLCPALHSDEVAVVADKFSKFMALPNRKKIDHPVGFFISLCQKFASGQKILPEIDSENDLLMKTLEVQMKERESARQKVEDGVLDLAFNEWMGLMTHRSRLEVIPGLKMVAEGTEPYTQACKSFYKANVWLKHRSELIENLSNETLGL
jgi:predicted transcriptional regulator